jgi:hypothetical protein
MNAYYRDESKYSRATMSRSECFNYRLGTGAWEAIKRKSSNVRTVTRNGSLIMVNYQNSANEQI